MIDFEEIWQKYSKYSRIEFVCFSFRVGLLFFINFSSFKPDAVSQKVDPRLALAISTFLLVTLRPM